MNYSFARLHRHLFVVLFGCIAAIVTTCLSLGELKPLTQIDWLDVLGEGGITLMTLVWLFFILVSRPAGRVTNWLFTGLTLTHISMLLDFLDEFIHYSQSSMWLTTVESLPAPIGMAVMSYALYHWHQEQNAINSQLRRTERFYREHSLSDFITGLYSAEYMKKQISRELKSARDHQSYFCLIMLDICDFNRFNHNHGERQGDQLLREVAQLILMNLRDGDLACRYASDRFIVLLPQTDAACAQDIAEQLSQAIAHLAFKTDSSSRAFYPQTISCVQQYRAWHNCKDVLADLNQQLFVIKDRQRQSA